MTRHRFRLLWTPLLAVGVIASAAGVAGCVSDQDIESVVSAGGTSTAHQVADREQQIEQYRDCLLRHGIPLLDYPTEEGLPQIDKGRTSIEKVSTALNECRTYLPTGGDAVRPAPADIEAWQRYAACIREHGVPSYPDPDPRTGEQSMSDELNRQLKNDPKLPAAQQACQSILASRPGENGTVGG